MEKSPRQVPPFAKGGLGGIFACIDVHRRMQYYITLCILILIIQLHFDRHPFGDAVVNRRVGRSELDKFFQIFLGNIGIDFKGHPNFLITVSNILVYSQKAA